MPSRPRQCLTCGMLLELPLQGYRDRHPEPCPKCEDELYAQSDGSTLTQDIAHSGETVNQALDKLERSLDRAWAGHARHVRLIVGGGLIHDEALGFLRYLESEGHILNVAEAGHNPGALLVQLRR